MFPPTSKLSINKWGNEAGVPFPVGIDTRQLKEVDEESNGTGVP